MKKTFISLIIGLMSISLITINEVTPSKAATTDYYQNVDTSLRGEDFILNLHSIISSNTKKYSYSQAWNIIREADEDPDNPDNVLCIYSGLSIPKTNQDGSAQGEGRVWNREHIWSKSHGFPKESYAAYTDCHHLRASEKVINSTKNNLDFDEVANYDSYTDFYTKQGYGLGNKYNSTCFEPRDEVKGDVARMIFYMATRYHDDTLFLSVVESIPTPSTTGTGTYGKLSTLLKWHAQDPVSEAEIKHNDVVYSYQNNRNPYIDHSEYVYYAFGGEEPVVPSVNAYTALDSSVTDYSGEYILGSKAQGKIYSPSNNQETASFSVNGITDSKEAIESNKVFINKEAQGYTLKTIDGLYLGYDVSSSSISLSQTKSYHSINYENGINIVLDDRYYLVYDTSTSSFTYSLTSSNIGLYEKTKDNNLLGNLSTSLGLSYAYQAGTGPLTTLDIQEGVEYILGCKINDTYHVASGLSSNKLTSEAVTSFSDVTYTFTFEQTTNGYYIKQGEKYLTGASNGTNVTLPTTPTAYSVWNITLDGTDGTFAITNVGVSSRGLIYRALTNIFGNYATSNISQADYYNLEIIGSSEQISSFDNIRMRYRTSYDDSTELLFGDTIESYGVFIAPQNKLTSYNYSSILDYYYNEDVDFNTLKQDLDAVVIDNAGLVKEANNTSFICSLMNIPLSQKDLTLQAFGYVLTNNYLYLTTEISYSLTSLVSVYAESSNLTDLQKQIITAFEASLRG